MSTATSAAVASPAPASSDTLRIGSFLRREAYDAPRNTALVELGCGLGARTAQMALGLRGRPPGHGVVIHCFDTFQATGALVREARKRQVEVESGADTLPMIQALLEPHKVEARYHRGRPAEAEWTGGPVSVWVDGAESNAVGFVRSLKTFGPSWLPGGTVVVLTDYHRQARAAADAERPQVEFIRRHPANFSPLPDLADPAAAAFLYRRPLDFAALRAADLRPGPVQAGPEV